MKYVHLRSMIKRIYVSINIYYFNQTIVSHSEISQDVWSFKLGLKSLKPIGQHVYEPCRYMNMTNYEN